MNAAQIREAARLLDSSGAADRDFIGLTEMGGKGFLFRIGDPAARHLGWKQWLIAPDGSSREWLP